jgi:hypothetical protein
VDICDQEVRIEIAFSRQSVSPRAFLLSVNVAPEYQTINFFGNPALDPSFFVSNPKAVGQTSGMMAASKKGLIIG